MSGSKLEIERVRYRQGGLLASDDLRSQLDGAAQLRWWHNRAVHAPFGVATGLEVTETVDTVGGRIVTVGPGVAHDAYGRELVLCAPDRIPLPAELKNQRLILRYPRVAERSCRTRRGVGELAWTAERDWTVRSGVPLVRTDAAGNIVGLPGGWPQSRPLAQPRMASGMTLPASTSWTAWNPGDLPGRGSPALGFQTTIDSASAGFSATPCYFAWLEAKRLDAKRRAPLAAFEHLESESPGGFTFCLWLPRIHGLEFFNRATTASRAGDAFQTYATQVGLFVRWFAVEPVPLGSGKD